MIASRMWKLKTDRGGIVTYDSNDVAVAFRLSVGKGGGTGNSEKNKKNLDGQQVQREEERVVGALLRQSKVRKSREGGHSSCCPSRYKVFFTVRVALT